MASSLCLWKAALKSSVLFTFAPQAAAELQRGSLWRHPSLSATRVDKMEHFLWWLSTSLTDIQLKLITRWKVSPWILSLLLNFPRELAKGINSAQVVGKQILWIQIDYTLSHHAGNMIKLLAVKCVYFQLSKVTRDYGKTCILPCSSTNVHLFREQ